MQYSCDVLRAVLCVKFSQLQARSDADVESTVVE